MNEINFYHYEECLVEGCEQNSVKCCIGMTTDKADNINNVQ